MQGSWKSLKAPVMTDATEISPRTVSDLLEDVDFDDTDLLRDSGEDRHLVIGRRVVATIGLFSIIKLARHVQLLIPAFDFCVPNKQCVAATDEDACGLFDTIDFPIDEFFPPQKADFPGLKRAAGLLRMMSKRSYIKGWRRPTSLYFCPFSLHNKRGKKIAVQSMEQNPVL